MLLFSPKCEEYIFSKIHYKNSVICDHIEEVRWYLWGAYNRTEPKHLVYLMTHKLKPLEHNCREWWPRYIPHHRQWCSLSDATCPGNKETDSQLVDLDNRSKPHVVRAIPALLGPSARTIKHAPEAGLSKKRPSGNIPDMSIARSPSQQVRRVVYSFNSQQCNK